MTEMSSTEITLDELFSALGALVNYEREGKKGELDDILEDKVKVLCTQLKINDWKNVHTLQTIKCTVTTESSIRWQFVSLILHLLLSIKECLNDLKLKEKTNTPNSSKAPTDILSVNQQKTIRSSLQFVVSLGLLPGLLKGVGIPLTMRSTQVHNINQEDVPINLKFEHLMSTVRGLLACYEVQSLRSLIISNHLGDLFAALFQLTFAPLKKPVSCQEKTVSSKDNFVMTIEYWNQIQKDRLYFRSQLLRLIREIYQPYVIRELMMLQGVSAMKMGQSGNLQPSPSWLKKACIQLLVECLMKSQGITALIRAICDVDHDSGKHWKKLETVVLLITTVHTPNPEEYFKNICNQIMKILESDEQHYIHHHVVIAVRCMEVIYKRDPEIVTSNINKLLFSTLYKCGQNYTYSGDNTMLAAKAEDSNVLVTEEEINKCITILHRIFIEFSDTELSLPFSLYLQVIPILFSLYSKVRQSSFFLISNVVNLLIKSLQSLSEDVLSKVFNTFLFGKSMDNLILMDRDKIFSFAANGGIQVEWNSNVDDCEPRSKYVDEAGNALLQLMISGDKSGYVTTNLFKCLLGTMCKDSEEDSQSTSNSVLLEDPDEEKEYHYILLRLMTSLSSSPFIHDKINNDPKYLIDYFLFILERDFKNCKSNDEYDEESLTEDLVMILTTVSVTLENIEKKTGTVDWSLFQKLVTPIKMIRDKVTNRELKMIASEVYNTIVTQGLIRESTECMTLQEDGTKKEECDNKKQNGKGKFQNVSEKCSQESETPNREVPANSKNKKPSAFEKAVLDACDPSIPLHGHGLIELTKLITSSNEIAISNKELILKIFQEDLKNEDSYIYLLAVNGLAAMVCMFPENIINVLIKEYLGTKSKKNVKDIVELRLKIGEILIKVLKSVDPNAPYTLKLLDAVLRGCKDPEPLIRASSLSNLGEVCKVLGFRVNSVIHEVLLCVKCIIQSDSSAEVRKAAAMVLTLLLQGLGNDMFSVIGDVLLEIYRDLKLIYQKESGALKLHVQLSLEEISKNTKSFMFPTQKLEKRLFILDPP